jgi:predicted O-linked N-acetylglucosamine transferase (SPINDLY family)
MRDRRPAPRPEDAFARALELHRAGRVDQAEAAFRAIVEGTPGHHPSYFALGLIALQSGRDDAAVANFARAAALEPNHVGYRLNLGEALRRVGRLGDASGELRRAVAMKPDFAEAFFNLGVVCLQAGDSDAGLGFLGRAVDLRPDMPIFHERLAEVLRERGSTEPAELHGRCARLRLETAGAWVELATTLETLGRVEGSVVSSLRAVDLDPRSAAAHAALAAGRLLQHRHDEAIASARTAIAIDPSTWLAHFHLGNALAATGAVVDALPAFRHAAELRPGLHAAQSAVVFFTPYAPGCSAASIGHEAREWARSRAERLASEHRPHANERSPERRLRVGFVSPDLRSHPVALFLRPLLAHRDRSAIEVVCYASVPSPDATTDGLRALSDEWRDVAGASDAAVAGRVRDDRIDVLFDLTMHASGGRPLLFARKAAPVQICWLAYAGTTGLGTMDHRITDPHLEPPGADPGWAAEAPLVLPETFWCYEPWTAAAGAPAPTVGPLPSAASGRVTFGSQHSIQKVNDEVLAVWSAVLRAVPRSARALFAPAAARASIGKKFEGLGIGGDRIRFLPLQGIGAYLEAYRAMDVCLDTFPCNGATSSMDALWMGVPVVTLAGETPAGRAGLSIAANLGLTELVTRTTDEYVATAVGLARDTTRLATLRAGLRGRMEASPLMDGPLFAARWQAAVRGAWRRWCVDGRG